MMKRFCLFISALLFLSIISGAQHLTTGFFSGINLSDIHANTYTGKWKFKPGPVQGVFADYGFTKFLGIRSGLSFSTYYYEHKIASEYVPIIYDYYFPTPDMMYPYPYTEKMDLSFLTIPLQVRLTVPSTPDLILTAGAYYSHLTNQTPKYYTDLKRDFGYVFSAGIDHPLSDDLSGLFNIRYIAGKGELGTTYHNGSIDFTVGIAYRGFNKDNNKQIISEPDTSDSKISIIYFGGVNFSRNDEGGSATGSIAGASAGFRIDLALNEIVSFRTGMSFEQKGYSFNDSSDYSFAHIVRKYAAYKADTRVTIDYLEIPALFNFSLGKSKMFNFSTGPWLAFKLNARATGTAMSASYNYQTYKLLKTTVYDDIGTIMKRTDSGWSFAFGAKVPVKGLNRIEMGLEYKHGFRNVYDGFSGAPVSGTNPERSIVNRTVSVRLGYIIPGRKIQ